MSTLSLSLSPTVSRTYHTQNHSSGGLAWIDYVQTGHLDGKKDALLGSFNIKNAYENKITYPTACYGMDDVDCNLNVENGEQKAGAPPGGISLLDLPLQLPSLCAVSGNAFNDDGTLSAPYAGDFNADLHATRLSKIRNILVGGANPEDFVSPVVADWDNDGFDDVIMVGGRNMHRISYLETSTCSNNRGDVCSGTSFSLSLILSFSYILNPIDYPVQVLDCAPRLTNLNVDVSWDIAVENVSFVTQTTT